MRASGPSIIDGIAAILNFLAEILYLPCCQSSLNLGYIHTHNEKRRRSLSFALNDRYKV